MDFRQKWLVSFLFGLIFHCIVSYQTCNKNKILKYELNQVFLDFWNWRMTNEPEFATKVGAYKYDDNVRSYSENAMKRKADDVENFLHKFLRFKSVIGNLQDPALALDYQLLVHDLKQYLSGIKFNTFVWPLNTLEGPQSTFDDNIKIMKTKTRKQLKNIISRLRLYSHEIDNIITVMKEGIRLRQTLHKKLVEKLLKAFTHLANSKIEEMSFYKPFIKKPVGNITDEDWTKTINEAKTIIGDYLIPAYKRLETFLRDVYIPASRLVPGISSVPNGKEFYAALLKYHTSTSLTPSQVHSIGLEEVERINGRMEKVKDKVKYKGSLGDFRQYLRTSKKFGFKNESEMLSLFRGIRAKVEKILPKYFGRLPKTDFEILPVPKNMAPTAPGAYYNEPSHGKPGIFYLNTYKPEIKRKFTARTLFLHEAIPGHHLQIALQIENASPRSFRRYSGMGLNFFDAPATFSMNTAYTEGWALYSEYLGEEMGIFETPYDLFGRLSDEMLRACRLVVDTGLHAFGWSRQKAIDYMANYTAESKHDIEAEIDRYIAMPGQACAYKIGERKIRELRKMAEDELGHGFDIRKFHDYLLKLGNIPLVVLEEEMKKFVKHEKKLKYKRQLRRDMYDIFDYTSL